MALIKQSSIRAVLDACDMVEIVSPFTELKKTGASFMGRCPFHNEKTPSFSVDAAQKLYYCFGCGEGGNAFTFIQKMEGVEFAEAVGALADKYGVSLEFKQGGAGQEEKFRRRERVLSLLDQAASYYARYLHDSPRAETGRGYLKQRGFAGEVIRQYRLGFSPPGGQALLRAAAGKGFSLEELLAAGLATRKSGRAYDRFRGRLMFPFTDHRGRVLGFGARVLDDSKPKYLNSPDSDLYHKGNLVFGLGNARRDIVRQDRAYVVEGYTDVMALSQAGTKNVVASMGTALTGRQLREIARFTRNLFLAFDADAAGQKAMLRAQELAKGMDVSLWVVRIPSGQDPADLAMGPQGGEAFTRLAAEAATLLEYHVQETLSRSDLDSASGRKKALAALEEVLSGAVDAVELDEQLRIIAGRLRLDVENVAYLVKTVSHASAGGKGETRQRVLTHQESNERSFLSLCLAYPGEARRYLQDMTDAYFTTEQTRAAFRWVRETNEGQSGGTGPASLTAAASAAGSLLPELKIRAQAGRDLSSGALHELYFRLSEASINRRISDLKEKLSRDDNNSESFKDLCRLEARRREIIELIQSGSYEV